jgi:DNA gyrase subunit A
VGIISIQTTDRNGRVVGIAYVRGEDELMLITQQGKVLRMPTSGIRAIGRATQGVRLIESESEDRVVSVARLAEHEEDNPLAE